MNNETAGKISYIYVLLDPDSGKCRYVGKAEDPNFRFKKHTVHKKNPRTHKERWINLLLSNNKLPILKIVDTAIGTDWIRAEIWWVRYFRKKFQPLTNETKGGDGFVGLNEETKRKMYTSERSAKLSKAQKSFLATHPHPCLGKKLSAKQVANHKVFLAEYYKDPANHRYGHECSDETKFKISVSQKKRFKNGILFHCQHCSYTTTNFGSLGAHIVKCRGISKKRGGEITQSCTFCGLLFVSFKSAEKKFCSPKCYHESRRIHL